MVQKIWTSVVLGFFVVPWTEGCVLGFCGTGCCSYSAHDCQDVQSLGFTSSGVYHVTPSGTYTGYDVYCDLQTDDGGGWLVFQRRLDGSENFNRPLDEYESGFGDIEAEHWLGLIVIQSVIAGGYYEVRVDMEDWSGVKSVARYKIFRIGDASENYRLTIAGYDTAISNAGDSMTSKSNGAEFSAHSNNSCATVCKGGWWYSGSDCQDANLNGNWVNGGTGVPSCAGIMWRTLRGQDYSMMKAEMKIRRL